MVYFMDYERMEEIRDQLFKLEMKTAPPTPFIIRANKNQVKVQDVLDANLFLMRFFVDDFKVLFHLYIHPEHTIDTLQNRLEIPESKIKFILDKYEKILIKEDNNELSFYSINRKLIADTEFETFFEMMAQYYEDLRVKFRTRRASLR